MTRDDEFFQVPESMKEEYTIKEFCLDWSGKSVNTFVADLVEKGLSRHDIACVIDVLNHTCHRCFDAPGGCRCGDDE